MYIADKGGIHELVHDHGVALHGCRLAVSPDGADKGGIHELVHDHGVALGAGYYQYPQKEQMKEGYIEVGPTTLRRTTLRRITQS